MVEVAVDCVEVEVLAVVDLVVGLVSLSRTAGVGLSQGGLEVTGGLGGKGGTKL